MDFQAVRLETLVRSVADRVKLHHPDMKVNLDSRQPGVVIRGDPKRLGQVFENLLNNAVKYAPGSDVWVTIDVKENEGVEILIWDQGPGIPQRYLPHIFERFFRNPELEPYVHGSGLGLFICKKIIQAHQGQIYATSTVGEGTTFHINLPS
jgi:signal transduction histidine kinase